MDPTNAGQGAGLTPEERRQMDALRETYLGESTTRTIPREDNSMISASRMSSPPTIYPSLGPEDAPSPPPYYDPHALVEVVWVKGEGETPMKVWYVENSEAHGYYGMDGTFTRASRRHLRSREISESTLAINIARAINTPRCVQRTLSLHLKRAAAGNNFPTAAEWREWIHPFSRKVMIEFQCQECDQIRKTFNRFGTWIDGAERTGQAVCRLLGRYCYADYEDTPAEVSMEEAEAMGVRQLFPEEGTPAELSEEEEEMHTPREVRESTRAATRSRAGAKKRITVGRPRLTKRVAPGRPPRRTRRTLGREEALVDLTKDSTTPRALPSVARISTPQAGEVAPPLMTTLHWDDEGEISNAPNTPISRPPPSSASQIEPTPPSDHRDVKNLQNELRELKLMMQEQVRKTERPPSRPTLDTGDNTAKSPDANPISHPHQPRVLDPWLDG